MFADIILVMDAGKIVERGSHEDLMKLGGLYARLWNTQRQEGEGYNNSNTSTSSDTKSSSSISV